MSIANKAKIRYPWKKTTYTVYCYMLWWNISNLL